MGSAVELTKFFTVPFSYDSAGGETSPTYHPKLVILLRMVEQVCVERDAARHRIRHNEFGILKDMGTMTEL